MEENSENDSIFDSLNLNPQLVINEILNRVDDLICEGFEYLEKEALERFSGAIGEEEGEKIRKGVSSVRDMIQDALGKRLDMWEKYCLRHCFSVPKGLSLPKAGTSEDSLMEPNLLANTEMDHELENLREKLSVAQKESVQLQREYHAIRKESISKRHVASIKEALNQQASVQDMFQEMEKAATELRTKIKKLKSQRIVEMQCAGTERIINSEKDQTMLLYINGLSDDDRCHLQEYLAEL